MAALRRLVDRELGGRAIATDYELHCGVNSECRQRGAIAEALEKELDQRYAGALRQSRRLKTTDALREWWTAQTIGREVPGALWATLTHPRCDAALEEEVLADIHMIQHQCGAADRADLARLNALQQENEVLARELAAAQQRWTVQSAEHARRAEEKSAELVRLRAELLGRDTLIATLQEDLAALEAAVPTLRTREELTRQVARQIERIQDLERAWLKTRHELERERHRADEAIQASRAQVAARPAATPEIAERIEESLAERSVLCVGGRPATLPGYPNKLERLPPPGRRRRWPLPAPRRRRGRQGHAAGHHPRQRRHRHLPDRVHQPQRLLAREGPLQAHRQALRLRRQPQQREPAPRIGRARAGLAGAARPAGGRAWPFDRLRVNGRGWQRFRWHRHSLPRSG